MINMNRIDEYKYYSLIYPMIVFAMITYVSNCVWWCGPVGWIGILGAIAYDGIWVATGKFKIYTSIVFELVVYEILYLTGFPQLTFAEVIGR